MIRTLRYGPGARLEIELDETSLVADFSEPLGQRIEDPAAAVSAALSDPMGYPALSRATVPGDRVVLALGEEVPQQAELIAGMVRSLLEGHVLAEDITVLLPAADPREADRGALRLLPDEVASSIAVARHDPRDRSGLAYLAASRENKPIYFNRQVFDADLVLPVSCLRPAGAPGYVGALGGLFPAFSDQQTRERFRTPASVQSAVQQRRHGQEAEEAAWLLGIHLMVQVVSGRGDSLLHVLAGEATAMAERGSQLCEQAWLRRLPQPAGLVVAAIEGGPEVQTWENFGRALHVALSAVADGGAVVLCTDLRCPPGAALQRMVGSADDQEALQAIQRERSADAFSASLLIDARQRVQVYLLSGLDEDVVEELGIGYVGRAEEVSRLCRQHGSCILVADAQRTMFQTPGPSGDSSRDGGPPE